ncbi:histidine kinase dimerization/phospho-acceptor domain-containing protein [Rhodothermus profundi]|uniref:histidine kinase n=1 Tax=Rhodothermus profundi TaxID=633813 RepID=A0A1M6WS18_9BACT|nr:histidine kinase dimerization/phospho-acceptor domain-containing protein [Rhodothermus profundi]SHK96550.1 His Kinase A (phospho-acceptor) domain-containing protein [Rhodothermus profundi]
MASSRASGVVLLVAQPSASASVAKVLADAGWDVLRCTPEELPQHIAQEQVRGVIVQVGPEAEADCLQVLLTAQSAAARPVLLLTESSVLRMVAAMAQAGWLAAAAPDQTEELQAWVQRLAAAGGASASVPLRHVRRELSRLNHDLKNPLAIISGNAQFLHELIRMRGGDTELEGPVRDIEEACQQIQGLLQRLVALRDTLPD